MSKVDSIYDFTDAALVELKAWLEPWFKPQDNAGGEGGGDVEWEDVGTGAGGGGGGDGIQFDTQPQAGDWLVIEATGTSGPIPGSSNDEIQLTADDGDIEIVAASVASDPGTGNVFIAGYSGVGIDAQGDQGISLRATGDGDIIIETTNAAGGSAGIQIESTGTYIRVRLLSGAKLRLEGLPTSDPGVYGSVWVDTATQTLKTHGY